MGLALIVFLIVVTDLKMNQTSVLSQNVAIIENLLSSVASPVNANSLF